MAEDQISSPTEQTPVQDPPSKQLWQKLYDSKAYTNSYDDFEKKYSTPESIDVLHEKLSSAKAYTNPKEDFYAKYFPDVKKNEPLPTGSHSYLENGTSNTTTVENKHPLDPILASLDAEANKTAKKDIAIGSGAMAIGGSSAVMPDLELNKQGEETSKLLKGQGVDSKQVASMFNGVPKELLTPENLVNFNQQLKDEPTKLDATLNHYKWAPEVMAKANDDEKQFLSNIGAPGSYEDKRKAVQAAIPIIRKYSTESDEAQKNFSAEASLIYGSNLINNPTKFDNTPEVKELGLSSNQIGAYQFLKDTQPDKAEQYKALLIDKSKIAPDDYELQYGLEEKGLKLEQIGLNLKQNAAQYDKEQINKGINHFNDIAKTRAFTPEEKMQVSQLGEDQAKNSKAFTSIEADKQSTIQGTKYLRTQRHDADQFASEILGQKDNMGTWALKEMGAAVSKTLSGTAEMVATPFRSEENNYIRQAQLLGSGALDEQITGLTQDKQTSITWKPAMDKELADKINGIKNDSLLDDEQKHSQVTDLLLANPNQHRKLGIDGGETNINLKSLLYGTTQLATNLAPFVAITAATGGGASASVLRNFATEFTAAATTGFNDAYQEAIKSGDENPYAKAMRVTAINSAAMAGAGTASEIRAMIGKAKNPAIDNLIEKLTDKEVMATLRKEPESFSILKKTYNIAGEVGESALNNLGGAAKITAYTTAGQVANDAISGDVKPLEDYVKGAGIELLKFGIFGTITAGLGRVTSKPTDLNKLALYEAAKSPEAYLQAVDNKVADNSISREDATQIKSNIEAAKKVMENVPMVDAKGNELPDASKRELLFLKLQEKDIDEVLKKDIPVELADKVGKRLEGLHEKMDEIYKGTFLPSPVINPTPKVKVATPVEPIVKGEEISQPIELNPIDTTVKKQFNEPIAEPVNKLVQPDAAEPQKQGVKEAIPESPDAVGQGEPNPANAVGNGVGGDVMPKEISDLYLEASSLRFTLNAFKMQMGGKDLVGKSKSEFENTKIRLENIELKISEYEKNKSTIDKPTQSVDKKQVDKKSTIDDTIANVDSKYGNFLLNEIDKRHKEKYNGEDIKTGLAKQFNETLKDRGENRAISNLEDTYMNYVPTDVRAEAYQALRKNFEKEQPKEEPTELHPEETKIANDTFNDEFAKGVIKDNGLTLENLENNKHLFEGSPFSKEDYEHIKNSLDETRRRNNEPGKDEQEGTGDVDNKAADISGKAAAENGNEQPGDKKVADEPGAGSEPAAGEEGTGGKVGSTSIKNEVVDAERAARGEEQFTKPDMRGYEKVVLPDAIKAVDSGSINHNTLAAELAANPRPISDTEVGILTYGRKLLQNEEKHLLDAIESAQAIGNKDKEMELRAQLDTNEANLINNDIASEKSGTATARGLAARRMVMADDYSLDRMLQKVRINNDGKVPKETREKIEELTKQLAAKEKELEDYHENQSKKAGEEFIKNAKDAIKKEIAKKIPALKDGKLPEKSNAETKKKVSDFFDSLKLKDTGTLNSSIIPLSAKDWNNFVEVIKKGVLTGVDIATAIKKGVEYLHGEKLDDKAIKEAEMHFKIQAGLEKENAKDKAYQNVTEKLADKTNQDKLASITPELTKLAKEYIKEGVSKMDDIVDKIHEKIEPDFEGLTKREVRDAISGYGKTLELSKDEIDKQLREIKAQARVISGLEDVEQGKSPLASGLQRDEQSPEVRLLKKQLEANMRKAGIEATQRDITKQLKTALDKVKRRFENQIEDMTKAIDELKKMPKNEGIEYDQAAKDLQAERDKVKEKYDKIFKEDKSLSDEQRIAIAKKALEKSIKEYQRRIDEKDFEPKKKNDPATSPELESLRKARDEARKMYNELMPEEITYKAKLDRYSKHLDKRQKELQGRIDNGDFTDKPKKQPLILSDALITKRAAVERTKRELDKLIADYKYKNRNKFEKSLDFIGRFRRGLLLSSVVTLGKLTFAAAQRPIADLAEGAVGSILHYPLRSISSKAPSEGGILSYHQDVKTIAEMWSKNTLKDTWNVAMKGSGELSLLMEKKHEAYRGVLDLAGQIHAALKNPVKRYAFNRAMLKRTAFALKNGEDIHNPIVQSRLAIESYADGQRAIFMQDNMISSAYSNAIGRWSKGTDKEKLAAAIAKFFLPIVKVPTNFIAETTSYIPLIGALKGGAALTRGIKNLKPEQADYVWRNFKKQGVGVAVFLVGYFGTSNIGGFYTGKRDDDELKAGDVKIFGMKVPHWMMHTPLWFIAQAGATFARIKHSYEDKGKEGWVGDAMKTTFKSTIDGIPFVQTPVRMYDAFKNTGSVENTLGATTKSLLLPPDLQKLAEQFDQDKNGETRKVDQKGFWKQLQEGIPGMRNQMDTKENVSSGKRYHETRHH